MPMLVDCFAVHESDFDSDNVEVLQAYAVDEEKGERGGESGGESGGEMGGEWDYVDDVEDEEEEAPIVAAVAATAPNFSGKKPQGGKHEDMRLWTPEEDNALMGLVGQNGKNWGFVAERIGGMQRRTKAMARNRYMRIVNGQRMKRAGKGKNRCRNCGELKLGHVCEAVATGAEAAPALGGRGRVGGLTNEERARIESVRARLMGSS
jgi:hypothetical protein